MTLFTVWLSGLERPINIEQTIERMQAVLKKKKESKTSRAHKSIPHVWKEFFHYVIYPPPNSIFFLLSLFVSYLDKFSERNLKIEGTK